MFTIKICGITRVEDALAVTRAGGDAIGLNFYAKSPRAIGIELAREIAAVLPAGIVKVGLFVNASAAEVCETFDRLGLDLVQLHGDEPPEYLPALGGRPVMKAFRAAGGEGLESIAEYVAACRSLGCMPRRVLLDAPLASGFGGTGRLADWELARRYRESLQAPEMVLAGGLTAENVAAAVRATGLRAVDTASGVESRPGLKDATRVAEFVQRTKEAVATLGSSPADLKADPRSP